MKQINLSKGKITIVDNEDYEFLSQWKWQYSKGGYARRNHHIRLANGERIQRDILMHRLIAERMGLSEGKIDHKDRDRLNNKRDNLRCATHSQNMANRKIKEGSTSGYLGVHFQSKYSKWIASMSFNNRVVYIGCFSDEIEAAKAYDEKAKELHGEFANLNFP